MKLRSWTMVGMTAVAMALGACAPAEDVEALEGEPLDEPLTADQAGGAPKTGADVVFPPDAHPRGTSMEDWAARWWQWVHEAPRSVSPILGHDCHYDQTEDAFFLAGNFGGTETRSCTLAERQPLLFPIVNSVAVVSATMKSCYTNHDNLIAVAARSYDDPNYHVSLAAELDGELIPNLGEHRVKSYEFFSWHAPDDPSEWLHSGVAPIGPNICGIPEGDRFGVADGYWIMLKPLDPGEHQLHFTGSIRRPNGTVFTVDITYNLTQL